MEVSNRTARGSQGASQVPTTRVVGLPRGIKGKGKARMEEMHCTTTSTASVNQVMNKEGAMRMVLGSFC